MTKEAIRKRQCWLDLSLDAVVTMRRYRGLLSAFEGGANPPPPTLWVIGRNDDRAVTPDDAELNERFEAIADWNVEHDMLINEPMSPDEVAFARIASQAAQVTEADSVDAIEQLEALGYLSLSGDPAGNCPRFIDSASRLNLSALTYGSSFDPDGFEGEVKAQIDELHGAHQITSDYKQRIVEFFLNHL